MPAVLQLWCQAWRAEGNNMVEVHTFRGTGRVFGFTEDATRANLPAPYGNRSLSFFRERLAHKPHESRMRRPTALEVLARFNQAQFAIDG